MANIECKGKIKTNNIEIEGTFSALNNIGGGFSIFDPNNVGVELGRKDGIQGTPHIDFHTDGQTTTDYNVRLIAQGNNLRLGKQGITSDIVTRHVLSEYFGKNRPNATTLFEGELAAGTINLSQSWQNFDMLAIYLSHDNNSCLGVDYVPTWKIKESIAYQTSKNREGVLFASQGSVYWYVRRSSLDKTLSVHTENSIMHRILGINWE